MSSDDLLPMIWDALGADRLTTLEATDRLEDLFKYRCLASIALYNELHSSLRDAEKAF